MWTLDSRSSVPRWRPVGGPTGTVLAFSTRRGGVSRPPYESLNLGRSTADQPWAVEENRRRLLTTLGLGAERLATAGQVHGADVARARAPGNHPRCDALVTTEPSLALAVSAADCLPILYAVPGAVAAAHSGWRGTLAGAPEAALRALCEAASAAPESVQVHLGPCIRECCYQVGSEVAARFPAATVRRAAGSLYLSLTAAVRLRLLEAGVPEHAVHECGACTACDPLWYFSHRRDRGLTGRQWGVAALTDGAS